MRHLILFFVFCKLSLWAQELRLNNCWDHVSSSENREIAHDFLRLQGGKMIAVVGESKADKRAADGFFALFSTDTGRVVFKRIYSSSFGADAFLSVADAGDGSFYMVGYSKAEGKHKQQGWWQRIDFDGTIIHQEKTARGIGEGNDRLEHILWLRNGTGLVAGLMESSGKGYVSLYRVDGNKLENLSKVGDGVVRDIIGMAKGQGCIWICGHALKTRTTKEGDVWVLCLDENGNTVGIPRTFPAKSGEKAFGMNVALDGTLMISGQAWNGDDKDIYTIEVPPNDLGKSHVDGLGKTHVERISPEDEYSPLRFKTPGNLNYVVVRGEYSNKLSIHIVGDNIQTKEMYTCEGNAVFHVDKMFWMGENRYILAGTSSSNPKKGKQLSLGDDAAVRLVCLGDNEKLSSPREMTTLKESNVFLDDDTHDNTLSPSERASLRFTINHTGGNPLMNGRIKVEEEMVPPGLSIPTKEINMGYLQQGGSEDYTIVMRTASTYKHARVQLKIIVTMGEEKLLEFPFVLEGPSTVKPPTANSNALVVMYPPPTGNGSRSRELTVDDSKQTIRVIAQTNNKDAKATDFKRFRGTDQTTDERSQATLSAARPVSDERYEYELAWDVSLEDGRNAFSVQYGDLRSDTIVFNYTKNFPDLYVLCIGVPYGDLKYTVKDATDFADKMALQKGRGFFNNVSITTLLTKEQTTQSKIMAAIEELRKQQKKGVIRPRDYVVVFVASHGVERDVDGDFGIIPSDFDPSSPSASSVNYSYVIDKYLNPMNCKKILFVDACHSGIGVDGKNTDDSRALVDSHLSELLNRANATLSGGVTFASCEGNQLSYEDAQWENGAFTEALLEALEGRFMTDEKDIKINTNINKEEFIDVGKLKNYLEKRVPVLVKSKQEREIAKSPKLTDKANEMPKQTPKIIIHAPVDEKTFLFHIIK